MKFGPFTSTTLASRRTGLTTTPRFGPFLGLHRGNEDETVADQRRNEIFLHVPQRRHRSRCQIELLEPTGEDTPVGRFLKRGPGVQQVCLSVGDLNGLLQHLLEHGVRLIDEQPRKGAGGKNDRLCASCLDGRCAG